MKNQNNININNIFLSKIFNPSGEKFVDNIFINEYILNSHNPIVRENSLSYTKFNKNGSWLYFTNHEHSPDYRDERALSEQLGVLVNNNLISIEKLSAIKEQSSRELTLDKEIQVPPGFIVLTTNKIRESFTFKSLSEEDEVIIIDIDKYLELDNHPFQNNIFVINGQDYCGVFLINRLECPNEEGALIPVIDITNDVFFGQDIKINLYFKIIIENKDNAFCYEIKSE